MGLEYIKYFPISILDGSNFVYNQTDEKPNANCKNKWTVIWF